MKDGSRGRLCVIIDDFLLFEQTCQGGSPLTDDHSRVNRRRSPFLAWSEMVNQRFSAVVQLYDHKEQLAVFCYCRKSLVVVGRRREQSWAEKTNIASIKIFFFGHVQSSHCTRLAACHRHRSNRRIPQATASRP